jgi:hypothetical protein
VHFTKQHEKLSEPSLTSLTVTRMMRFGRCAISTRSDSARPLPSLPSLAIRDHKRERLAASRYQSSVTPCASSTCPWENQTLLQSKKIPTKHRHKHEKHRQLTISTFLLFRCFDSRDPTQVSSRPCANQYIPRNTALLKDPTCARSRENSIQSGGILHKLTLKPLYRACAESLP